MHGVIFKALAIGLNALFKRLAEGHDDEFGEALGRFGDKEVFLFGELGGYFRIGGEGVFLAVDCFDPLLTALESPPEGGGL